MPCRVVSRPASGKKPMPDYFSKKNMMATLAAGHDFVIFCLKFYPRLDLISLPPLWRHAVSHRSALVLPLPLRSGPDAFGAGLPNLSRDQGESKCLLRHVSDTSKTCEGLGLPPPALGHGSEGLGLSLLSPLRWTWPGPALPRNLKDINDQ